MIAGAVIWAALWGMSPTLAAAPEPEPGAALRARHTALAPQLARSALHQPLVVESAEEPNASHGDVYALVDYPIAAVSEAFANPAHWCDVLILHLNVKYCRYAARESQPVLSVAIGRKFDQPVADAFQVQFAFRVVAARPDYLQVSLSSNRGPFGTRNYAILFEAVGLEGERTFVHVRYAGTYGLEARIAMQAYLATAGAGKVGFTRTSGADAAQPQYIGGLRGAIERNTMRYYLAVAAYLDALATPASERFDRRLQHWFSATEAYARQLHEVDQDTYIAMKHREYLRQQSPP